MKLSESQLRRIIRQQLRTLQEQAVATGARGRTPLSDQQKREIANRFRDAIEAALIDRGLVDQGENWSLMVNLGRSGWSMGKRAGVLSTADRGDVRRAVAAVIPQFSGDRQNLIRGRRLKLALSDTGAPPAREEEDPAPQSPRTPRSGGGGRRGGGGRPCVQMRQQDLNSAFQALGRTTPTLRGNPVFPLDVDGIVGPMTEAAFYVIMERELVGDICDEANSIDQPEPEPDTPPPEQPPEGGDPGEDPDPTVPPPEEEPEPEEDPCVRLLERYIDRACEDLTDDLREQLESMRNPLMRPSFYEEIAGDDDLWIQFTGFGLLPNSAQQRSRFQRTLTRFEELLNCHCRLGEGTHTQLAEDLIESIELNSYIFGQLFTGLPDILLRLGRDKGAEALRWLANSTIGGWIPGLDRFKNIRDLDDEQTGWGGLDNILGFDPPGDQEIRLIMETAEAIDRMACPPEGQDPELPERYQRRYIEDCDELGGGGGTSRRVEEPGDTPEPQRGRTGGDPTTGKMIMPPCMKIEDGELVPDWSGTAPDGSPCDNYLQDTGEPGDENVEFTPEYDLVLKRWIELAGIDRLPYPEESGAYPQNDGDDDDGEEEEEGIFDKAMSYWDKKTKSGSPVADVLSDLSDALRDD